MIQGRLQLHSAVFAEISHFLPWVASYRKNEGSSCQMGREGQSGCRSIMLKHACKKDTGVFEHPFIVGSEFAMVILGSFAVGSQLVVKQQLHPSKILGTRLEVDHGGCASSLHRFGFGGWAILQARGLMMSQLQVF